MLRVGIAGCGKIAQMRHLPEYDRHPGAQILGLFDLNMERAGALARQYHAKTYATFEEMLADPQLDAVSICTVNAAHAAMTIAALEAGKHVLCEKPMAVSLSDCEEMVRAARESGRELMIGQNQRLTAGHVKAKELLDHGEIGRLITFTTAFRHGGPEAWTVDPANNWFFDKKRALMGALADLGIHKTDLIQFLSDQRVTEVQAYLGTLDKKYADGTPIGVDDNAICIYRMSGGSVGTMSASWTDYCGEENSTVLFGTEGVMRIYEDPAHSIVLQKRGGKTLYFDAERIQTNDAQTKSGIVDMFVDHLNDRNKPFISGESVLTAMRAVFAALESSETGRSVIINS